MEPRSTLASQHRHRDHSGDALVAAAARRFEQAGEKWTGMRAEVFKALSGFDQPASAYDIAEAVSGRLGRRVAPNSIYRILDLFVANNVATRVESQNAYIANIHPGCRHDCIFLVCDGCGATTHLDDDRLSEAVRDAADRRGFHAIRPVIEVRGRCARCG